MPRLSNEAMKRYILLESSGCIFCGNPNRLQNLYHPKSLRPDEAGVHVKCCSACYGSYKAIGLDFISFEIVKKRLSSRHRRVQGLDPANAIRWTLGLTMCYDLEGLVACAEDSDGMRYEPVDVNLFIQNRHWIVQASKEQVEKWCNDNLTDQRFIIRVVSSFSS